MDFSTRHKQKDEVINPSGFVVTNERIIITDEDSNEGCGDIVRVFNRGFQQLFIIVGPFKNPKGVSTDKCNCIYVADCGNDRIVKFLPDGTYNQRTYLSKSDEVFQPHGLAVHNDLLFVCDPKNTCIRILDMDLHWKFKVEFQHLKTTFIPEYIVHSPRDNTFYVLQGNMQEIMNVHMDTVACTGRGYRNTSQKMPLCNVSSVATCDNNVYITLAERRVLYFTSQLQYVEEKNIERIICVQ